MIQLLKPLVSFLMFLIVMFSMSTILSITTSYSTSLCMAFALVCAALVGWSAWKLVAGEKMGVGIAVISGALMLGGLCFVIGFFGPMAFAKDTSQGPLIGLFIAAPLGVIMGAIGGYLYVSRQNGTTDN